MHTDADFGMSALQCLQLPGCGRVEMGATWLHGLKGNPLYAYAVEKGIMLPNATQKGKPHVAARSIVRLRACHIL